MTLVGFFFLDQFEGVYKFTSNERISQFSAADFRQCHCSHSLVPSVDVVNLIDHIHYA